MKCQYIVKSLDPLKGWCYMNSFTTYSEACEAIERYKRLYQGRYIVDFDYYED